MNRALRFVRLKTIEVIVYRILAIWLVLIAVWFAGSLNNLDGIIQSTQEQ